MGARMAIMQDRIAKKKSFAVLLISLAFWSLGISLSWLFLGLYVYWISDSIFLVTLFSFLPQITWIVSSLIWGYLGDRFQLRRIPLILASLGYGFFLLPFWFTQNTFLLLVAYSLANLFGGAHNISTNAYVTLLREKKAEAVGFTVTANSVGWTVGTLLSGLLLEMNINPQFLFLLAAIVFISSGVILFSIEEIKIRTEIYPSGLHEYLRLLKNKSISLTVFSIFLLYSGIYIIYSVFNVYFVSGLGGSVLLYGIASGMASLLGGIVAHIFGKIAENPKIGRIKVILISYIGYIFFISVLLISQDPIVVAIMWMLPIFAGIIVGIPAFIADHTEEINRSKGMALFDGFQNMGIAGGYFLSTMIAGITGISNIVEIMQIFLIVALSFIIISIIVFLIGIKAK